MSSYFVEIGRRFKMDENWPNLINQLMLLREKENDIHIRIFEGAKLDFSHKGLPSPWLYLLEIKTSQPQLSFNLDLIVNHPSQNIHSDLDFVRQKGLVFDLTPDDLYKLGFSLPPSILFPNQNILRINPNPIYFPFFPLRYPPPNFGDFIEILKKIMIYIGNTHLNLPQEQIEKFFDWYYLNPEQLSQQGEFFVRRRTINGIVIWDVFPQDFKSKIHFFPFFQIFFPENNEGNFDKIRIDSGCQIGQIYDDGGCDCRWQFIEALHNGFTLLHSPLQDGRGYGTAIKMKTEQLKHQGQDTIQAARNFFGEIHFDIRKYQLIAEFLKQQGVIQTTMFTDNREKIKALTDVGIKVSRNPTNSAKNCIYCATHIIAKHNTDQYFSD